MPDRPPRDSGRDSDRAQVARLEGFGERLPWITDHFTLEGALGLLLIDGSDLAAIERSYGSAAHERALGGLGALAEELVGENLGINDLVVAGETGRNEILVLVFREASEVEFYKRELPELRRRLVEGLRQRGSRVGYPYLKAPPTLHVGTGAALRNPTIGGESQVRAALEEARSEVGLSARLAARRRRRQIFELVLEGRVTSVYEPIVDVTTRTVFGYEALARGPEGSSLHSPAALFALATEQDLIFQLDCLCRQSGLDGARDLPGRCEALSQRAPDDHSRSELPSGSPRAGPSRRCRARVPATSSSRCRSRSRSGTSRSFEKCATTTESSASRSHSTTPARATPASKR